MPIVRDTVGAETVAGLAPGSHVIVLTASPDATIGARKLGLEVRDCILVVSARGNRFAFLLRKELEGTVAENVLKYGTGALNIDGCRVSTEENLGRLNHTTSLFIAPPNGPRTILVDNSTGKGRWPTNLVFLHGPECRRAGTKRVRAGHYPARRGRGGIGTTGHRGQDNLTETHDDGLMPAYDCEPGCPVAALDQQSGTLKSGATLTSHRRAPRTGASGIYGKDAGGAYPRDWPGDSGGASRFYPQFESEAQLHEWLGKLIGEHHADP